MKYDRKLFTWLTLEGTMVEEQEWSQTVDMKQT